MTYTPLNPKFDGLPRLLDRDTLDAIEFRVDMAFLRALAAHTFAVAATRRDHLNPIPLYCDLEEETVAATGIDPNLWPVDHAAQSITAWRAARR